MDNAISSGVRGLPFTTKFFFCTGILPVWTLGNLGYFDLATGWETILFYQKPNNVSIEMVQ
jgi:hypothetical protein